jgi:hypothetical protein
MHRHLVRIIGIGLFAGLWAGSAQAGPIGTVEWNNATFTIELTSYDVATNQYSFTYTADFTDFAEVDQDGHFAYLIGINFKPSEGNLVGYSGVTSNVAGTWAYNVDSNLSSSNQTCGDEPGDNDFFCGYTLYNTSYLNPTAGDPIYTWNFTLTITGVTNPEDLVEDTALRALFTDGTYTSGARPKLQTSLMSETTTATPVPEPTSLSLLGLGIGATGLLRRYKKQRDQATS